MSVMDAIEPPGPLERVLSAAINATEVDVLDRLLALWRELQAMQAKRAYDEAHAAMQAELPVIQERGEIRGGASFQPRTYALWEDIAEAIMPVVTRHGFSLSFRIGEGAPGSITVTAILAHREGHSSQTTLTLPIDNSGGKNVVQAHGSAVSYGQRYTARALLNFVSRVQADADDDGAQAGGTFISVEQLREIEARMREVGAPQARLAEHLGVSRLSDLPASAYKNALQSLDNYAAEKLKRAAAANAPPFPGDQP